LTSGLVRMLAVVGAENSRRVLLAMALNYVVKLLIRLSSDGRTRTFLCLALVTLLDHQRSLLGGQNQSYITLHKIYK
jgi:hypothetical protein